MNENILNFGEAANNLVWQTSVDTLRAKEKSKFVDDLRIRTLISMDGEEPDSDLDPSEMFNNGVPRIIIASDYSHSTGVMGSREENIAIYKFGVFWWRVYRDNWYYSDPDPTVTEEVIYGNSLQAISRLGRIGLRIVKSKFLESNQLTDLALAFVDSANTLVWETSLDVIQKSATLDSADIRPGFASFLYTEPPKSLNPKSIELVDDIPGSYSDKTRSITITPDHAISSSFTLVDNQDMSEPVIESTSNGESIETIDRLVEIALRIVKIQI